MRNSRARVALITGAGRGIGRATAEAFADAGYAVVIAERAASRGRNAARSLRDRGAKVAFVHADVSDAGAAERAVNAALRRFGALDVVVNNAGVLTVGRFDRLSRAAVREMVEVDLLGYLYVARAAVRVMRRRRRGRIVNVASMLGKEGLAEFVPYCATKFGVIGLTEALADELRGTGVRVWSVCPDAVDTPMARKGNFTEKELASLMPPERVARVIVDLAIGKRRRPSGAAIDVTG